MISAERRGTQAGMEYARMSSVRTPLGLRIVARAMYLRMREQGFAHLEPVEQFITGFISGVQQFRLQRGM